MSSDEGLLPGCFRLADLASWLIDPSRTMTTRRASVQTRDSAMSVRDTDDGEGLARTADDESDHSSTLCLLLMQSLKAGGCLMCGRSLLYVKLDASALLLIRAECEFFDFLSACA